MSGWEWVATIVYFIGVAGSLAFVIRRLLTRWWRYAEGMALLMQHLMWVLLGANTVIYMMSGDHWWRIPFGILVLFLFGVAVWWLTILQERARLKDRAYQTASTSQESDPLVEDHQLG